MEILSDRQRHILEFISQYIEENDRPPTNREIGHAMSIASTGHVDYHLTVLAKKGYIEREANTSRGLKLTLVADPNPRRRVYHVPVVGYIAAGAPIEAITDPNDAIELSDDFASQDAYALRVRGKSMIEDLIDDGDLVVIRKADSANSGEIVVALVMGEEATLKRLRKRGASVALEAANPAYETRIFGPDQVQVQGRLVGLMRRYH